MRDARAKVRVQHKERGNVPKTTQDGTSCRPRSFGNVSGEPILSPKTQGAGKARKAVPKKSRTEKPAAKTAGKTSARPKRMADKPEAAEAPALLARIFASLDADKAEDIVTIDLKGRSSLADALVIASGRSSRHVASIAERLARKLKEAGYGSRPLDGLAHGDWVLVDAGDVIVHVFRPEVRRYYDLEGMWSVQEPERAAV